MLFGHIFSLVVYISISSNSVKEVRTKVGGGYGRKKQYIIYDELLQKHFDVCFDVCIDVRKSLCASVIPECRVQRDNEF